MKSQGEWVRNIVSTDGCTGCHQLGNKATREIPKSLGVFDSGSAAWDRRIQSGQAGAGMSNRFTQVGRQRALAMYADWTDRIAAGELPTAAPPRPQGSERNVVITMWDWADPHAYLHDEIASDKRNPTVNANGPIYGALEASRRVHAGRGTEDEHGEHGQAAGSRSEDAERSRHAAGGLVTVLGR